MTVHTVEQVLRKYIQGTRIDWDIYVPNVQLAMNHKVSKRLQTPPFSLMYARHMNLPYSVLEKKNNYSNDSATKRPITYQQLLDRLDYMAEIVFPAIKERTDIVVKAQKEGFDKSQQIIDIPIGSYVVARLPTRNNKLAPAYEGPFTVVNKTKNGNYVLKDMTGSLTSRNYTPSD